MTEQKNEPVRITIPPRPDKAAPSGNGAEHPLVRIVLPTETPVAPVRRVPPKITPCPASQEAQAAGPTESRPKNETARISTLPPPPAVRLAAGVQTVPLLVTSSPLDPFEAIPTTFRWVLFGIASANFLIQIWIYVVS